MSLNKLTTSSPIKEWMNIGCNELKCNSLTVDGVTNPEVSPYVMLNTGFSYNIVPLALTEIAGGNTTQVPSSTSEITFGDNKRYNFKVVGTMTNTQPFTSYYLKLGSATLNSIINVNYPAIGTPVYVEISGSFIVRNGFPTSADVSSVLNLKISDQNTGAGVTTPIASVESNRILFVSDQFLALSKPKFAILMSAAAGDTSFVSYDSFLECSFSD
jgi:hypothetical protein